MASDSGMECRNSPMPKPPSRLMKVLTSPEVTGKVAGLGANIPPLKAQAAVDAFLASAPPANGQAFLNGAGYKDLAVEAPLWTGNFGKFSDAFGKAWGDMVAGKVAPEDLGKTACAAAADAFKK